MKENEMYQNFMSHCRRLYNNWRYEGNR